MGISNENAIIEAIANSINLRGFPFKVGNVTHPSIESIVSYILEFIMPIL